MMKDLGTRPIELLWITVQDIDLHTGTTAIMGAKHTIGRERKLKPKTLELLKVYIEKRHLRANDKLFNTSSSEYSQASGSPIFLT